jgi:hypothetical protein
MGWTITNNTVEKTNDGKYMVKSKICNTGSSEQTVTISEYPYGTDNKKIGAAQAESGSKTFAAGECKTMAFEFPADMKPDRCYTDVWQNGSKIAGVITDLQPKQAAMGAGGGANVHHIAVPYPHGLEVEFPTEYKGPFVLEPIGGIPAGWAVTALWPQVGVPFDLDLGDLERSGALLVNTGPNPAEGTVATLELRYRAIGHPDEFPFVMIERLVVAVDTTPPSFATFDLVPDMGARTIEVRGNAIDTVSGLGWIEAWVSTDQGETLSIAYLAPPPGSGAGEHPVQSVTIGPFCAGQRVDVYLSARDHIGNTSKTATQTVQF